MRESAVSTSVPQDIKDRVGGAGPPLPKTVPVAADHQQIPFLDHVDWPSQELRDLEWKLPTLTWDPLGLHWPEPGSAEG